MMNNSDRQTALLEEIRDLLLVVAEPHLAARDAKARDIVREIAGKGVKKRKAVLLMDGTRSRSEISEGSGLDAGNLSRLVTELKQAKVVVEADGRPRTVCHLPEFFFEVENAK